MKKFYYITIVAAIAIVCLQVNYVSTLYNRYVAEKIIDIDTDLRLAIDEEQHIRYLRSVGSQKQEQRYILIKEASDMSPQELDSLKRISPINDAYNVDEARQNGIGETTADVFSQVLQDMSFKKGMPIHLPSLDSIFNTIFEDDFQHTFLLYNKDKVVSDSVGNFNHTEFDYETELIPVGTKGLQYLQLRIDISMYHFLELHIWSLVFSGFFMIVALFSLIYQLIVLRIKNELLRKREESINGTIHDLKAPLNSVVTMLGWLYKSEPDGKKKETIEVSRSGVKHLVGTIESLLAVARGDRKKIILNKVAVDIPHLVTLVRKELDVLYRDKPHTVEIVDNLPDGYCVCADSMYIENVIRNLIENSLKYSDDGVEVVVTLSLQGGMLQVSVKDNGWGIAPRYQKQLFDQFYQVPRSDAQNRKGYGIGLTQVKYIIAEHGGKITVKSTEGQGSEFTFTIPQPK